MRLTVFPDTFVWSPQKQSMQQKLSRPLKNDKKKRPQEVWVDDGTDFLGAFKTLCNKRGIHLYSSFSEKKVCIRKAEHSFSKIIIYKSLEEKWT